MAKYEYRDRDIMKLDEEGDYYTRHILAMTRESLINKSDIAAELGWRDREMDRLRREANGELMNGSPKRCHNGRKHIRSIGKCMRCGFPLTEDADCE